MFKTGRFSNLLTAALHESNDSQCSDSSGAMLCHCIGCINCCRERESNPHTPHSEYGRFTSLRTPALGALGTLGHGGLEPPPSRFATVCSSSELMPQLDVCDVLGRFRDVSPAPASGAAPKRLPALRERVPYAGTDEGQANADANASPAPFPVRDARLAWRCASTRTSWAPNGVVPCWRDSPTQR